ncbi:hypothetical protein HUK48_03070 [Prevotella corporis]|uniref:hypothetical protein n=1 Tax=Prevotella corporis TaxID=28128 RepID=UPI0027E51624|nr:hypothetical protein [Prevotella corporis]MDQ7736413.1 hypothetical protein [Prevotella corporis]
MLLSCESSCADFLWIENDLRPLSCRRLNRRAVRSNGTDTKLPAARNNITRG